MRIGTLVVLAAILLTPPAGALGEGSPAGDYGDPLSAEMKATPIVEILENPDAWSGKRVRIEGTISGVCSKQGCWMDLTAEDDATLRVKVDDGVIVFPEAARGLIAAAEGTVEILEMEREKYEAWLQHVAEEEGRPFDPAEVGEGPFRIVRLRGLGARISEL